VLLLLLGTPLRASAQAGVSVETSPQLFAVLCALHAAGYEENVSDAGFLPIRAQLRGELLRLQGPAVEAVRQFYRERRLLDSSATLSRYVSFALLVGPPPKFEFTERRDALPPDVLVVQDFGEVLGNFYREARIEQLWQRVQPDYAREALRLRQPLGEIVFEATGYLREIQRVSSGRVLTVYVEPLVGAKTNFRNYGDRYIVVLGPAGDLPLDEIRHSYLHFLLDPLALRYTREVAMLKPLQTYAGRAPRLPVEWRDSWSAFVTECLVRAVELRLQKMSPQRRVAALDAAERDGFVLIRAFDQRLAAFEKAEPAMTFYFPDLLSGVDVGQEATRLENVHFAAAEPAPSVHANAQPAEPTELERWLDAGDRHIARQNAAGAVAAFDRVLEKYPGQPRARYGLAVAYILQGEMERAKTLLRELIQQAEKDTAAEPAAITPTIRAWSHVYLGRIYDVEASRELALSEYRAALAVPGAPEAARLAAQRGIDKGYEPGRSGREQEKKRP
jgi:Tfp pilus assembly protein PilF